MLHETPVMLEPADVGEEHVRPAVFVRSRDITVDEVRTVVPAEPRTTKYDRPKKLGIVNCLFEPVPSKYLVKNYATWQSTLPDDVPVVTVRMLFKYDEHRRPPERANTTYDVVYADRATQCFWQKERLLNRALSILYWVYPDVDAVAWVDPDVIMRTDWVDRTLDELQYTSITQCFSECLFMSDSRGVSDTFLSLSEASECDVRQPVYGHPGFAWAMRRDLMPQGFFEWSLTGSGDTWMGVHFMKCQACRMRRMSYLVDRFPGWVYRRYLAWADELGQGKNDHCTSVPGTLVHLYHGERTNRKYSDRPLFMREAGLQPSQLREAKYGLLATDNREFTKLMVDYFRGREA